MRPTDHPGSDPPVGADADVISVRPLRDDEAERWQAYVSAHPEATVYHMWPWKNVFERSFGYRSWYLVAEQGPARTIVGCLPLFLVSTPFSRRLVAVPFRDRGGVLCDTPAAFDALVAAALQKKKETRARFIELKSLTRYERGDLRERLHWVRSRLPFERFDHDVDQLLKKVGPKTRNMLRQAERANLTCEVLESGIDTWYPVYLETQQHLGLPPLPRLFFDHLAAALEPTRQMRVFAVRHGARTVASSIVLLHRRSGIYGYSASSPQARNLRPNDLMMFTMIRWLLENGFDEFDMGSDSPKQESLLFFKRKWLAEQTQIPSYFSGAADVAASDSSDARYALVRSVFRYLPTPILHLVGRLVARYFG